jgi:hypothetical protein
MLKMRYLVIVLLLFSSSAYALATHCSDNEQILFSCQIAKSHKVVSLCAAKELAKDRGYVRYIFGKLGKPEFTFPSSPANALDAFNYEHYFRAQVDRTAILFVNHAIEYRVFDNYDGETQPHHQQGVSVIDASAKETSLFCATKIDAHLEKLRGVIKCNQDNPLFDCE